MSLMIKSMLLMNRGSICESIIADHIDMNRQDNYHYFLRGIKIGMPIALGYFAVAFTLGITARNAGMNALEATLASLLCNASAGEYAGFTVIAAGGTYVEMILMEIVANARYLLMSCSLSQKFSPDTHICHRLFVGFDLTDEIFGATISEPGKLNPLYSYGMFAVAIPGWSLGTLFGVLLGNVLPDNVVSALSVGLYGMFLAIIIPPAHKNKVIGGLVVISMAASFAFSKITVLSGISASIRTIILTVLIAGAAAVLFPVDEEKENEP